MNDSAQRMSPALATFGKWTALIGAVAVLGGALSDAIANWLGVIEAIKNAFPFFSTIDCKSPELLLSDLDECVRIGER